MDPKNGGFQQESPFPGVYFQVRTVSFKEGNTTKNDKRTTSPIIFSDGPTRGPKKPPFVIENLGPADRGWTPNCGKKKTDRQTMTKTYEK